MLCRYFFCGHFSNAFLIVSTNFKSLVPVDVHPPSSRFSRRVGCFLTTPQTLISSRPVNRLASRGVHISGSAEAEKKYQRQPLDLGPSPLAGGGSAPGFVVGSASRVSESWAQLPVIAGLSSVAANFSTTRQGRANLVLVFAVSTRSLRLDAQWESARFACWPNGKHWEPVLGGGLRIRFQRAV